MHQTPTSLADNRRARGGAVIVALVLGTLLAGAGNSVSSASPSPLPVLPGEPWIVYQWFGSHLVRPDGSDNHIILPEYASHFSEPLLRDAMNPDWSPDGSQLLFLNGNVEGWPIWVANVDGTDVHEIVPCGEGCQFLDAPAWSPDGTKVAYAEGFGEWPPSTHTDRIEIEVLDLTTGEHRTVLRSTPPEFFQYPRWSPDGRSLVLMDFYNDLAQTTTIASAIAIADISGPGVATPRTISDWDMNAGYPDWDPKDDLIVFSSYDLANFPTTTKPVNLYTVRTDGSDLRQVTQFGDHDVRATQPTWTPDGEQIIFTHITPTPADSVFGELGYKQPAFIAPDGTGLRVIEGFSATHPRLRPTP
jgi:Tol biopolymer transport system component